MPLDGEAPPAPGPLQKNPVAIIGIVLVVLQALVAGLGIGELKDGFQAGDIMVFVSTVIAFLVARMSVFSQATVDLLAPRSAQAKAVEAQKRK